MAPMYLSLKQKQTHRHGEKNCGCQGEWGGNGRDWEFWVSRGKHLELLSHEVLLYSAGNYIQSLVIEHDRG